LGHWKRNIAIYSRGNGPDGARFVTNDRGNYTSLPSDPFPVCLDVFEAGIGFAPRSNLIDMVDNVTANQAFAGVQWNGKGHADVTTSNQNLTHPHFGNSETILDRSAITFEVFRGNVIYSSGFGVDVLMGSAVQGEQRNIMEDTIIYNAFIGLWSSYTI